MKKLFAVLTILFCTSCIFAKQYVTYKRYIATLNVAKSCSDDVQTLIDAGYRIVSVSLDYQQKCAIIVYEDNK